MSKTLDIDGEEMTVGMLALEVAQIVDVKKIKSGFVRDLAIMDVMKKRFGLDVYNMFDLRGSEVFTETKKILDSWS